MRTIVYPNIGMMSLVVLQLLLSTTAVHAQDCSLPEDLDELYRLDSEAVRGANEEAGATLDYLNRVDALLQNHPDNAYYLFFFARALHFDVSFFKSWRTCKAAIQIINSHCGDDDSTLRRNAESFLKVLEEVGHKKTLHFGASDAPDDGVVTINGESVPVSFLDEPIVLNAGTHTVLWKKGNQTCVQQITSLPSATENPTSGEGETNPETIVLHCPPAPPEPECPPAPPEPECPPSPSLPPPPPDTTKGVGIGLSVGGATLVGTGLAFFITAGLKEKKSDNDCGSDAGLSDNRCTAEGIALNSEARGFQTAGIVTLIVSAALLTKGIINLRRARKNAHKNRSSGNSSHSNIQLLSTIHPGASGILLQGKF